MEMAQMPPMLAYTIQGSMTSNISPGIAIGQGQSRSWVSPASPQDNSYWIAILDANNPGNKVQEFVVEDNTDVPQGLDQYMSNPAYIFALVTQYLSTMSVPQGDFYDYLVAHGAGRALQWLEQINTSLGCGSVSRMSYALTGQCGSNPPIAYEKASTSGAVQILMSLMPLPSGQPPYTICDTYTFLTR